MNTPKSAEVVFGGGRVSLPLTYLGAPIQADFELSFEALAPYVTHVLDMVAPIEGSGRRVTLVTIKNGVVTVTSE